MNVNVKFACLVRCLLIFPFIVIVVNSTLRIQKMNPIFAYFVEQEEDRQRKRELQLERKMLRSRLDPLNIPDKEFIKLFRLNKEKFQILINEITPHLDQGQRSTRLAIETRVLAALRFFATYPC